MLKKSKFVTSFLLIAALIFGSAGMVFANDSAAEITPASSGPSIIQPYRVVDLIIGTKRSSSTSGLVLVDAILCGTSTSYTSTCTLQEKSGSSWVTATGVSPVTKTVSGKNDYVIYYTASWNLKSTKAYRVKVYIKNVYNGVTHEGTYYSDAF